MLPIQQFSHCTLDSTVHQPLHTFSTALCTTIFCPVTDSTAQPFFSKKSLRPTRASQQNTGFTNFHQNAPISDVYVSRGNLSHLSPATKALNVTISLKHSCHSGQTRHSKISVQEKYIYYIHPCRPCLHRLKDILGILLCRQTICLIQLLESPSPLSVTTGFLVPFRFW